MTRIWFNHWFSTVLNIIELIKKDGEDFYIIGSNDKEYAVYRTVCDEWYVEPVMKESDYVEYCLNFCREHKVDVFMPRRSMTAISQNKARFEEIGVKVMVEDFEKMDILNHKEKAYEFFLENEIGHVPEYRRVTTLEDFLDAYFELESKYKTVCFKFVKDEGGNSFRIIDNRENGYSDLFRRQSSTRMSLEEITEILPKIDEFSPMMVMPYLPGKEISVDCLKTEQGIIMVPRYKGATRNEKIKYDPEIIATCEKFYEKMGLEWPCNIQFKLMNDVTYFLEVNTRMSGGVQLSCVGSGINIPNIAVNKILGVNKPWENNFKECQVSFVERPIVVVTE